LGALLKNKKIVFCGLACAGKTTAQQYFKGSMVLKFAQPHYDVLQILGVKKHRAFMQEFSDLAKKYFGEDIFIKIFERKAKTYSQIKSLLICEDLRYLTEFESCLKNGWTIVYIEADEKLRKERSDKLGLEWRPDHNSEQDPPLFKNRCHHIITNNGTIEEFKQKLFEFKKKL